MADSCAWRWWRDSSQHLVQRAVALERTDGAGLAFASFSPAVIGSGMGLHTKRRMVTGVGAAIAMTGLKITLQSGPGNHYDTGPRPIKYSGPSALMDDQRVS